MKIIQKIKTLQVKRVFVTAQKLRLSRKKGMKYLPKLSLIEFLKKLSKAKRDTAKLSEKELDKIIYNEWPKRLKAYNNAEWYRVTVSPGEVGVWRRAGGLPSKWTCCSLAETANYVKMGLVDKNKHIRARSKRAIPRIMEFNDVISKDKYLYPIAFKSGTGTKGRRWCKGKVKVDIDNGCMRSIALTVMGYKKFNVYFGK